MPVNERTKRALLGLSGNLCAFPDCNTRLVQIQSSEDPYSIVGEVCHIKGDKPGSARYDASVTEAERHSIDNLILLCSTHHKLVDDQPKEYSVQKLQEFKRSHKAWAMKVLSREIAEVTFSELDVTTKYLIASTTTDSEIRVVAPREKIRKNELSGEVENLITMGLARSKLVQDFLNRNPDPEFGERLKEGFVDEYNRLVEQEGLKGDILFISLLDFASHNSSEVKLRAAGLTVLSYFFETCDVFET